MASSRRATETSSGRSSLRPSLRRLPSPCAYMWASQRTSTVAAATPRAPPGIRLLKRAGRNGAHHDHGSVNGSGDALRCAGEEPPQGRTRGGAAPAGVYEIGGAHRIRRKAPPTAPRTRTATSRRRRRRRPGSATPRLLARQADVRLERGLHVVAQRQADLRRRRDDPCTPTAGRTAIRQPTISSPEAPARRPPRSPRCTTAGQRRGRRAPPRGTSARVLASRALAPDWPCPPRAAVRRTRRRGRRLPLSVSS